MLKVLKDAVICRAVSLGSKESPVVETGEVIRCVMTRSKWHSCYVLILITCNKKNKIKILRRDCQFLWPSKKWFEKRKVLKSHWIRIKNSKK